MTSEFMREKTRVRGSLTPAECQKLIDLQRLWARRTARTEPVDPNKIIPAIEGIYAAAGLKRPWIAIARSPLELAFANGAAAAACQIRDRQSKMSARPGKSGTIETVLRWMTSVVSEGEFPSEPVDATEPMDRLVSSKFGLIFDLTETETHVAAGSEPRQTYGGKTYFRGSPLFDEVRQSFSFAWWWLEQSPIRAVASITSRRISVRRARELRLALEAVNDAQLIGDATNGTPNNVTAADAMSAAGRSAHSRFARRPTVGEIELLAAQACHAAAGQLGLTMARKWRSALQGGDTELPSLATLAAFRDVLGIELPSHGNFAHWEQAAIEAAIRVMHQDFCIVCDFPEVLRLDEQDRPHCADGPSHRWRDGWALYHWHGTRVPQAWIEDKASLTAAFALTIHNTDLRRAALEIVGWHNVLRQLNGRIVAEDVDPQHGKLVDVWLPGLRNPSRFLHVQCGTGREFAVCIPRRFRTVKGAHAWLTGLPTRKFKFPAVRT
jgi:hypothetical protein